MTLQCKCDLCGEEAIFNSQKAMRTFGWKTVELHKTVYNDKGIPFRVKEQKVFCDKCLKILIGVGE